jgi:hypothetical protein
MRKVTSNKLTDGVSYKLQVKKLQVAEFLVNKNCLGSFQVLWNKNCTTVNEEIMLKKLIYNLNQKNKHKSGKIYKLQS